MPPQSGQTYTCTCSFFPDGHQVRKSARLTHNLEIKKHHEDSTKSTESSQENDLPGILAAMTMTDNTSSSPDTGQVPMSAVQDSVQRLLEARFQKSVPDRSKRNPSGPPLSSQAHKQMLVLEEVEREAREIGATLDFSSQPALDMKSILAVVDRAEMFVRSAGLSISKGVGNTGLEGTILQRKSAVLNLLRNIHSRVTLLGALLPQGTIQPTIPILIDADHILNNPVGKLDTIAQVTILLVTVAHFILGLSGKSCDFIVSVVSMIIQMSMSSGIPKPSASYSIAQSSILQQLPTSLYTALGRFHLDGKSTTFAACPACNFTHMPVNDPITATSAYPTQCTNQIIGKEGSSICGADLLVTKHGSKYPIKPFVSMSLKDYLARTLTDPVALHACKEACDNAMQSIRSGDSADSDDPSRSVFDSSFMRSFEGPVPGELFIDRGDTIRLAFALHVDFFNPNTSRRAAHESIGIISIANLNLPEDIRYTPEFIFPVGVIPGPHEPPLEELNHYLRPIIDELVIGWSPGYHLTPTPDSADGEHVQIAAVISINDLPAARKVSGTAGTSANIYCTVCNCRDRKTLYRTDIDTWGNRDPQEMRRHAEAWRDAQTQKERSAIEQLHGVRWSELWRLPYWNPVKMLVVDSMHCILEGLVHYHCRYVLRLDAAEAKAQAPRLSAFSYPWTLYENNKNPKYQGFDEKTSKQVRSIQTLLERPLFCDPDPLDEVQLRRRLLTRKREPLMYVVDDLDLLSDIIDDQEREVEPITKEKLVFLLVKWRLSLPLSSQEPLPKTCDLDTLSHIQNVIKTTDTPSWIHSVPHNYGEAAAGIIKAGEWRILSTIHIPIALVALWGDGAQSPSTSSDSDSHFLRLLDHSMALFEAVTLVVRNTATASRASRYKQLLKQWVDDLHILHPHTAEHPKRVNVHVAFHIYDFLTLFGPVMSWWTFPFERLIGVLQRINTNDLVGGPLECTILQSYTRGANLRRWLRRPDCPAVIREFKVLFDKAFSSETAALDSELRKATSELPEVPKEVAHYRHRGVNFSRSSTHVGNSLILYYPTVAASTPIVGCIQKITVSSLGVRLHVQRQTPLRTGQHDPFKRYPSFPAMTYSATMEVARPNDIITFDSIITHVARFTYMDRAFIVNLSRV